MNKIFSVLLLAGLAYCPSARAQHYYYAPNSIHIVDLSGEHDGSVRIGYGRGAFDGFEAQGAYSPVNHLGVTVNYFGTKIREIRHENRIGTGLRFLEGGACVYQVVRRTTASLMLGFGQGHIYNYYGKGLHSNLVLQRWFLQPGLHYADAYFQGGFSLRFSRLAYPRGDSDFAIEESELAALRTIEASSPFLLPELGLYGALRLNPFAVGLNISTVFPNTVGLNFSRINLGLFLTLDIGDIRKATDKKEG